MLGRGEGKEEGEGRRDGKKMGSEEGGNGRNRACGGRKGKKYNNKKAVIISCMEELYIFN